MATISGSHPRRKPATYGKAFRKPPLHSSHASEGTIVEDLEASCWDHTKSVYVNRETFQIPSIGSVPCISNTGAETLTRIAPSDNSEISNKKQISQNKKKKKILQGKARKLTPSPKTVHLHDAGDLDTIYNVPSSDDSYEGRPIAKDRRASKRMRFASQADHTDVAFVYDDESLQRHVAAEACQSPNERYSNHRYAAAREGARSRRKTLTETPCRTTTRNRQEVPNTQNIFNVRDRTSGRYACEERAIARVSTLEPPSKQSKGDHASWTTSAESPRASGDRLSSATDATQPQTPPQTRPESAKHLHGSTTPRQQELWSMLPEHDRRKRSPGHLNLPSLTMEDSMASSPQVPPADNGGRQHAKQTTSYLLSQRRRLVDNLHHSEDDRVSPEATSDESITSGVQSDSYVILQSQAPTEKGVLLREVSDCVAPHGKSQVRNSTFSNVAQPPLQGGPLKVTYACQRSYLTEDDLSEATVLSVPMMQDLVPEHQVKRRGSRNTETQIQSFQFPYEEIDKTENPQGGAMRSIHELREAGGNARLISEMETILDDTGEKASTPLALRRSRLLDLIYKLQEPSFCRLFIEQGLELRLFADIGLSSDAIINASLTAAFFYLLATPKSAQVSSQIIPNVVEFLVGLLDIDQDLNLLSRDRKLNLSKLAQLDLRKLCDTLKKSAYWRAGTPPVLTARVLSLQCLEYLVRQPQEGSSDVDVLSKQAIRGITRVMKSVPYDQRASGSPTSKIDLWLAVSILESYTLSVKISHADLLWTGDTLDIVVDLLPLLATWSDQECGTLRTLVLRLYLNLTNNSPQLCDTFNRPEFIIAMFNIILTTFRCLSDDTTKSNRTLLLDNLILSLGSLINLAEWCDSVRQSLMNLYYGDASLLNTLLLLFTTKSERAAEVFSEEETSSNVAFGYLSVLLCFLCLNDKARAQVSSQLQGKTLEQLLDAVEQFLHFHKQIEDETSRSEGEVDLRAGFIDRLQRVIDDLKH